MQLKNRNAYYGLIHKGHALRAEAVAGQNLLPGAMDNAYRAWLAERTGQRSCKGLTFAQLQALLDELIAGGWLKDLSKNRPGGKMSDRPTDQQWRKLAALTKVMEWKGGLNAHELRTFVQRTAKVSGTRFLTKVSISQVITGLENWIEGGGHGQR
jgi:hypothetical protein